MKPIHEQTQKGICLYPYIHTCVSMRVPHIHGSFRPFLYAQGCSSRGLQAAARAPAPARGRRARQRYEYRKSIRGYVCARACMYFARVCMSALVHVCVCVCARVCVCAHVCMYVSFARACPCVSACLRAHARVCECECVCVYVCPRVCACVCFLRRMSTCMEVIMAGIPLEEAIVTPQQAHRLLNALLRRVCLNAWER